MHVRGSQPRMEGKPKKLPVPFQPTNFILTCSETQSNTSIPALTKAADQAPEHFDLDAEMADLVMKDLDGLIDKSKEQLSMLQERASLLQSMVKDQFGIEDPEKWLAEQSKETKPITLTIPADVLANKTSGTSSLPATTGTTATTLRIKLVDSKPGASGSVGGGKPSPPIPPVGRGAGSKNLSRMNRPQDEAAKAKAVTQIPINVFWNQVEPFFKPVEDSDMKFLCDPSRIVDPSPFIIPPLGRPFLDQWKHQYGYVNNNNGASSKGGQVLMRHTGDQFKPTLKERLLSLLIDEGLPADDHQMDIDTPVEGEANPAAAEFNDNNSYVMQDYTHLDIRLRQELAATGFEEFANCALDYQEDDMVCTELRNLQRQLQEQVAINYLRKRKLADHAKSKLPAQEFYSLLSDLDKQLEQIYLRRMKSGKKKKKSGSASVGPAGSDTPSSTTAPAEAVRLLENRAKLLAAFAPYIPKLPDYLASENISLVDPAEETKVIQIARETGSWLPLPSSVHQQQFPTEFTKPLPSAHPVFPK